MAESWRYAVITGFEYVSVGGRTALLRLSASPPPGTDADGVRPLLVADDGASVYRYVAIPAPVDTDEEMRAAYSVPASLLTPATVFSLEFDDGHVISLPEPIAGAGRVGRRAADPAGQFPEPSAAPPPGDPTQDELPTPPDDDFDFADDAEDGFWDEDDDQQDRRSDMPLQVAALSAEIADTRRENTELRDVTERTLQAGRELREALLHQHVVLAETNAELAARRDLHNLSAHAPADAADEAQLAELRAALDAAQLARDEAIAAREAAETSASPDERALRSAERERDELREQVRLMTLDREEADRQAVAFDGVAVKARERATEAEAEAQRAAARLSELEMWSAELERRLAEVTTQLADAKLATETGDAEVRRLRGELAEAHAQAELDRAALAGADAVPADTAPGGAAPAPPRHPASLQEIGQAAVTEAHALAARDLADASS